MIRGLFLTAIFAAAIAQLLTASDSPKSEDRIAKYARHEILSLPYFDVFDNINFRVEGYTVTLMGQVTKPTLKSDAENAVKGIEGVENVVNEIEVLPLSGFDDHLRIALYRAIYGYSSLQRYALPVIKPIRIISGTAMSRSKASSTTNSTATSLTSAQTESTACFQLPTTCG